VDPRYPFVAVDVDAAQADEIGAAMFELGATGVEQRDDDTLVRGPGGGRVTVVASFEDRAAADEAIEALRATGAGLEPRLEEIVGDAWRDAWKEHFAPFALTSRITVAPPWIDYQATRADEQVLRLEPGRAFGTGLHATTSLCAEALEAHAGALAGRELCDAGTGSGILALTALLLGAARAFAFDNDPDVIEVVRENAERNRLANRIEARACTTEAVTRAFSFVVANIETRVLLPLAPELARLLAPGGVLVLSGVLAAEERAVRDRYAGIGLRAIGSTRRSDQAKAADDWVALTFTRG
jgi:ribosomal protein L11 methyltransferase